MNTNFEAFVLQILCSAENVNEALLVGINLMILTNLMVFSVVVFVFIMPNIYLLSLMKSPDLRRCYH